MKAKILKPVEMNIHYLDVYPGDRVYTEDIEIGRECYEEWGEIKEKYPSLFDESDNDRLPSNKFILRINVDTGKVENWPEGILGNFRTVKVVDEGVYVLRDAEENEIHTHDYAYVPECLQIEDNGWGDYFEFVINKNGFIHNWKFAQKDVDEIMGIDNEDD